MGKTLTPYGVCYNLEESPFYTDFIYTTYWSERHFRFFFSSHKHKESFEAKLQVRVPWLIDSMTRRFGMTLEMGIVAVFQVYNQVETRGFYVVDREDGTEWRSADQVVFGGLQVSWKDSTAKAETTTEEFEQHGSATDTRVSHPQ